MPKSVFTDSYQTLLTTLIAARKDAGVTQVELAKRLGKPQPWVSNYENGIRRIDVIEFIAIAQGIGEPAKDLFETLIKKVPNRIEI
jgi:transcriptional regulator with XRE-family HTH domain